MTQIEETVIISFFVGFVYGFIGFVVVGLDNLYGLPGMLYGLLGLALVTFLPSYLGKRRQR